MNTIREICYYFDDSRGVVVRDWKDDTRTCDTKVKHGENLKNNLQYLMMESLPLINILTHSLEHSHPAIKFGWRLKIWHDALLRVI